MMQVPIPRKMTVCHEKHKADLIEFEVENITLIASEDRTERFRKDP